MSKRQLNIIYFVDSSKTRTIKLPLGRVTVLLLLLSAVLVWSAGSAFLLNRAYADRVDLTTKLKTSLATVFDYETRYDGVYDVAYPSGKTAPAPAAVAAKPEPATPPSVASALARLSDDEVSATGEEADEAGAKGEDHPAPAKGLAAKSAPQAGAKEAPKVETKAERTGTSIVVGNPVIEAGPSELQVKFDLTNKTGGRAEGYIWAVAEFKSSQGAVSYIADPPNVGVKPDGDVKDPTMSSNFGIRKFKKMSFTFPVNKELNGTFTGIKIAVTDRSGANRTTYNVPVEIKVGSPDAGHAAPEATNR